METLAKKTAAGTQTGTNDTTGTPQTGDSANFFGYAFAMIAAVALGGVAVLNMKKKRA